MNSNPPQRPSPPPSPAATKKLLALDYGERRVGVALSDDLGLLAHPRPAIVNRSPAEVVSEVTSLVEAEGVGEVVVGLPLTMSGAAGHQARETRGFVAALRSALAVPVIEVDERLSSQAASGALGDRERKRSGQRDSVAAALILQAVLDSRREGTST